MNANLLSSSCTLTPFPAWNRIAELPTANVDELFSWLSDNPLPGEAGFSAAHPGKNIVLFDERWPWVESNMLPPWGGHGGACTEQLGQ